MAVRLKKLHESAQARYDKAREGLIEAVAKQPKPIAGDYSTALLSVQNFVNALAVLQQAVLLLGSNRCATALEVSFAQRLLPRSKAKLAVPNRVCSLPSAR